MERQYIIWLTQCTKGAVERRMVFLPETNDSELGIGDTIKFGKSYSTEPFVESEVSTMAADSRYLGIILWKQR